MTLEEAIKQLKLMKVFIGNDAENPLVKRMQSALDMGIKALEQTMWIPVTERLPEKEGYYLTTTMYHEVFCDYWNKERFERTETIIAWMPLPPSHTRKVRARNE